MLEIKPKVENFDTLYVKSGWFRVFHIKPSSCFEDDEEVLGILW